MIWKALLILCLCSACDNPSEHETSSWQTIAGRDTALTQPIYRARIPSTWQRIDSPSSAELATDTTKPICRFLIQDANGTIDLTVHNFPAETIDQRIPPQAQVARWQRQLGARASTSDSVIPVAHGGFVGLELQADGVRAWSLQLGPTHYRTLSQAPDSRLKQQMRADYTLKATGPESALNANQDDLSTFARSFELIDEIPLPDQGSL